MLLGDQNQHESITARSFDIYKSSNGFPDQTQKTQQIDQTYLNKFMTILPVQVKKSFGDPFEQKQFDSQSNQIPKSNKNLTKSKKNENFEEMGLIDNYLVTHNKFKNYFKSKKYKQIYHQLVKKMPLQKSYYCLYMQDKLFALNKHIKLSLIYKETSFIEYLSPYFDEGKSLIKELYNFFLVDDELYKGTKKVNTQVIASSKNQKSFNINEFFYILITFLYQQATFYRSKNQRKQAEIYYLANLNIVYKLLQSSTASCRLRRKICQYFISFSSFLIESRQLLKATRILQLALQNCLNLIGIIETRLKFCFKGKKINNHSSEYIFQKFKKRTNQKLKESFELMIAIFLNKSVIFQLENKQHLSYLALNQVRNIEQILYKNYSIKSRISQVIKKPKESYDYHCDTLHVTKCYFDFEKIQKARKEDELMKFNENVAIYGLKKSSDISFMKSRNFLELFFDNQQQQFSLKRKRKTQNLASKVRLNQYDYSCDSKVDLQTSTGFEYTINTKTADGSHLTNVYKQRCNQIDKKSEIDEPNRQGVRRKGKKLSNLDNLAQIQGQISWKQQNSKLFQASFKQFKKTQHKVTYTNLKDEKNEKQVEKTTNTVQENKSQNKNIDFLDRLIDSELEIEKYFLYGKDFIEKYDLLSKGKTLHNNNQTELKIKPFCQPQSSSLTFASKENQNILRKNSKTLIKEAKNVMNQPFGSAQNQRKTVYLLSKHSQNNRLPKENLVKSKQKKRTSKSLGIEPMNYKHIVQKMQNSQKEFVKQDYFQKTSIYRLKCRSQNVAKSRYDVSQLNADCLNKTFNKNSILNTIKKQNQRQAIVIKLQNSEKAMNFFKKQLKTGHLSKKTLNSNLFSSNETGIRLLKKIIFKHKKTLKIMKPNLFVNYHKLQSRQEEIKLVDRQSLLMVQYDMCQAETKVRIKENMQQLISDNLRNSEENEKRVRKLNKTISSYHKNKRFNQFSSKMQQEQDPKPRGSNKLQMSHNSHYFANTQTKKIPLQEAPLKIAEQLVQQMFENRIIECRNDIDYMGLGNNQKFLADNKTSSPNLFLSSIKYKQQTIKRKKIKTLKKINIVQDQEIIQDESQQNETINGPKRNTISQFLGLFQGKEETGSYSALSDNWL